MGKLFDTEDIMRIYWKDKERTFKEEYAKEVANETAKRLIRKGKMSLEDIADCVPDLSLEELKKLEAEVTQPA